MLHWWAPQVAPRALKGDPRHAPHRAYEPFLATAAGPARLPPPGPLGHPLPPRGRPLPDRRGLLGGGAPPMAVEAGDLPVTVQENVTPSRPAGTGPAPRGPKSGRASPQELGAHAPSPVRWTRTRWRPTWSTVCCVFGSPERPPGRRADHGPRRRHPRPPRPPQPRPPGPREGEESARRRVGRTLTPPAGDRAQGAPRPAGGAEGPPPAGAQRVHLSGTARGHFRPRVVSSAPGSRCPTPRGR